MKSIFVAVVLVLISLYFVMDLPWTLGWMDEVLFVLRAALPIFFWLVALIALVVGIANIKDKALTKKEMEDVKKTDN